MKLLKQDVKFTAVLALVVLADQFSKLWISAVYLPFESRVVIPGFFNLTYVTNTGAAFGFLAGEPTWWRQIFFITIALAALVILFVAYRRNRSKGRLLPYSISLIAGGAFGNLLDRLRCGAVVDFFDFHVNKYHWPAFNVADSAITLGVVLFLLGSFGGADKKKA